ncbi:Sorting nexin-31, partial [Galemys pyrenaicus]
MPVPGQSDAAGWPPGGCAPGSRVPPGDAAASAREGRAPPGRRGPLGCAHCPGPQNRGPRQVGLLGGLTNGNATGRCQRRGSGIRVAGAARTRGPRTYGSRRRRRSRSPAVRGTPTRGRCCCRGLRQAPRNPELAYRACADTAAAGAMKMHFCIPTTQQRPDALGGRYVLYSVYLDGFLFCRVRYSQLHRWNEQASGAEATGGLRASDSSQTFSGLLAPNLWSRALPKLKRVFRNHLPPFPPKYYLAMTTAMVDERREQLEQYLQNVTMDPNVLRSDVFIDFLKLVQLDTFSIAAQKVSLDIFLPGGRSIKVEVLTSDTAERVLEVVSHKIGLCRELLDYFGLFLIRICKEGKLSVIKKLADFELPYVSLRSSEAENCRVGLRKWYLDPSLDTMVMGCLAAVELIYTQALKDIEEEWAKPTQVQRQKLETLQKEDNQTKFLELSQEVRHYGYMQLDPCTCDYPEPGCRTVISIGNNEISCCMTLPDNQTQDVVFQMSRIKCWQVTFLGTLLDADGPQGPLNQNLELRFQYSEDSHWSWFVIYTKQAFLLSSCLKKMISEKTVKLAAENPEMIEVPEQGKKKKYFQRSEV